MAKSGLIARVLFLVALGGGLVLWSQHRRPRDLTLQIDLSSALPGEIVEVDVVVRRAGRALGRHDIRYGTAGAPGLIELPIYAPPGNAEVEATLVYAAKPARRTVTTVKLDENASARLEPR